ncbi:hypothetical protein AB751O23_BL_00080 [Chlamydiales bacterium SCGC AB-751-O23]|jgi:hypothetical protein|nr:hypothetical protein AB751O23_BL_00080 [Chlamydiales bacterium SCGC AB-751-O23]
MNDVRTSSFQAFLEQLVGKEILLKINQNKSTYLSVSYPKDSAIKASIHKVFLDAELSVIQALAKYLKGSRNKKNFSLIKAFVHRIDGLEGRTTSKALPALHTDGEAYDLKEILASVLKFYFNDQDLGLEITWYTPKRKRRLTWSAKQSVTFGEYHAPLKLIKINSLIDNWEVPKIFVNFIVYHEILHNIYPPKVNERGHSQIHHKEFREAEKKFLFYDEIIYWKQTTMQNFLDKNHRW